MISVSEELLSVADAAKKFRSSRAEGTISPSTVVRWIKTGVKTPTGRVKLEGLKVGGGHFTTLAALDRFAQATSAPAPEPVRTARTPARRKRIRNRVHDELVRRGLVTEPQ